MESLSLDAVKVLLPATIAFLVGIFMTPTLTRFMYKWKLWRCYSRRESTDETFAKAVKCDSEGHTPRVGGVIIWLSVLVTMALIFIIFVLFPNPITAKLEFLSRAQTFIPLATLFIGSLLGLADDLLIIFPPKSLRGDPIKLRYIKIIIIALLGALVGWWLYTKLGIDAIHVPFDGQLLLGPLFIAFFVMVTLGVFSTSVIDGVDGLSGGVLAAIFASYAIIALWQHKVDLAAFCAVVSGGTLAFLWFNIPPARFYMGETGMMGLTLTLSTVAFLTDTVLLLPLIAFPLFVTSLSDIIQMTSKKLRRGKRVFIVAPLHHHFEAIGWSREKITMRYWIIGVVAAGLGTIISFIS